MKYLALIVLFGFLFAGCGKDSEPQPDPQPKEIMRLNFINGFVNDPFQVIVFISAPDGSLLADTSFSENGQHVIMNPYLTTSFPDTFMVTIARYDLYWHSLLIQMNTFQAVTSSEWTIEGGLENSIGQATVNTVSVPEFKGLILYSNQGYSNYTSSTNPQTCTIFAPDDDFYLKLNTIADGFRYKWLEGFSAGMNYDLDLSVLEIPASTTVPLPFTPVYYEGRLWGFADDKYTFSRAFLFDLLLAGVQPQDQLIFNFPPGRYSHYRTLMMIRESYQDKTIYYHNSIGDIPTEFRLAGASLTGAQYAGNENVLSGSGTFDMQKAQLYHYNSNNEIYEWNLHAPPGAASIVVPELSPLLVATFPAIDTAIFRLKDSELFDFEDVTGYYDLLNVVFDKNKPRHFDQLGHSTVVMQEFQ
jgi:hypothetical protein